MMKFSRKVLQQADPGEHAV